ncbi:hypothetical protein ABZ333_32965, partial [Streptomyces olivaceus]
MSRETDSPSSGPHGRGGAAYPSGTPPYGTPTASDAGADAGRSAARPEERKTETTLTTRIRINIPGSRPIPPVVVRKPVGDAEGAADDGRETKAAERPATAPSASAPAAASAPEAPAEPAAPAGDKPTSDWFAPRKSGPGKGTQGGGATNGAGLPGGSGPASGAPGTGGPASGAGARPGGGSGRPGGAVGSMNAPGGSRPGSGAGSTNGAGLPGATGGPVAPGHGGGTGSFDVTEALAAGPLGNGSRPSGGSGAEPRRDDLPFFSDDGTDAQGPGPNGKNGPGGQSPYGDTRGPAGPTGGPVTGDSRLAPPPAEDFAAPGPRGPGIGRASGGERG